MPKDWIGYRPRDASVYVGVPAKTGTYPRQCPHCGKTVTIAIDDLPGMQVAFQIIDKCEHYWETTLDDLTNTVLVLFER